MWRRKKKKNLPKKSFSSQFEFLRKSFCSPSFLFAGENEGEHLEDIVPFGRINISLFMYQPKFFNISMSLLVNFHSWESSPTVHFSFVKLMVKTKTAEGRRVKFISFQLASDTNCNRFVFTSSLAFNFWICHHC